MQQILLAKGTSEGYFHHSMPVRLSTTGVRESHTTDCGGVHETEPQKMYTLPRLAQEIRINNYNPVLLLLWKANIDLQFVDESSLAVAQYIMGYVTKAERSNMQELRQEVSSRSSVYSKLFSFGVRSLCCKKTKL